MESRDVFPRDFVRPAWRWSHVDDARRNVPDHDGPTPPRLLVHEVERGGRAVMTSLVGIARLARRCIARLQPSDVTPPAESRGSLTSLAPCAVCGLRWACRSSPSPCSASPSSVTRQPAAAPRWSTQESNATTIADEQTPDRH